MTIAVAAVAVPVLLVVGWRLGGLFQHADIKRRRGRVWWLRLGRPDYSHNTAWWRKRFLRWQYRRTVNPFRRR